MTQAFNLSQFANKVNTSGQADLTTAVTGVLPAANGGTGLSSPGISGNVLMSNGSVWTSTPIGGYNGSRGCVAYYGSASGENLVWNSNGNLTFTVPAGISTVKVTLCGGGGAGAGITTDNVSYMVAGGGGGAFAIGFITGLTAGSTVAVTVGAAGVGSTGAGTAGGTSSFGAYISCTGGAGGNGATGGAGGTASGAATFSLAGGAGWNRTSYTYGCGNTGYFGSAGGACGVTHPSLNNSNGLASPGASDATYSCPGNNGMLGGMSGTGRRLYSPGNGYAATGYGNGGGGSCINSGTTNYTGGNGTNGIVMIEW